MKEFRVLNLYACLGGNRYKWDEVAEQAGIKLKVTAVELDEELAKLYSERFPNDNVIVTDAHEYLRLNFRDFDFIWSSPPCPSHSGVRISQKSRFDALYPDFRLYEEVVFLQNYYDGMYCIENVTPYYEPLIPAQKRGRHLYWASFIIPNGIERKSPKGMIENGKIGELSEFHDYDFRKYKGNQRRNKIARNLVDYEAGKAIFAAALGISIKKDVSQLELGL